MAYIIDPQIVVPAFSGAISQLTNISLIKLGVNINSVPFWLSVIGFPLAMFEVFTRHIATAINVLLRKTHHNTVQFFRAVIKFIIVITLLTAVGLFAIYDTEHAAKMPNISLGLLTLLIKYTLIGGVVVLSVFLLSFLSYLAGQGNQVAGIGFIIGTIGLVIESVQNFGFTAKVALGITAVFGVFLWHYGNKHNKAMELKGNKQEDLIDGIQRRREHLRNL